MTGNYLYVDPDGLTKISGPYADAAERFIQLSGYLSDLRSRYADAWGNDDLGNKVSPQVQQALQAMQDQVDALGRALGMYGEGLRTTSKAYRDADENAGDAATQFRARTERIAVDMPPAVTGEEAGEPRQFMRAQRVEGRLLQPMDRIEAGTLRPMRSVRRLAEPGQEGYAEPRRFLASRLPADIVYNGVEPLPGEVSELEPAHYRPALRVRGELMEPAEPLEAGVLMEGRLIEPAQSVPAQRVEGRLLEPAEPLRPAYKSVRPAEPAHYRSVDPGIPAEPLRPAYRSVHPDTPAEPLRPAYRSVHPDIAVEPAYYQSAEPGVPGEPLLPAHYRSVDPGVPAEPLAED